MNLGVFGLLLIMARNRGTDDIEGFRGPGSTGR
jgi:hypothetical protein